MDAGSPRVAGLIPRGTFPVAAGIVASGLGAYGFLIVSARALGPSRYSDLSVLWALSYIVGPGLFLPLEQEISRALSARRARGFGAGPVVRRAGLVGGVLAVVVTGTALTLHQQIAQSLLGGDSLLAIALALSLISYSVHHAARGALSGRGDFGRFGAVVAVDGTLRFGAAIWLAAAGTGAGAYGLAIAIAPALAAMIAAGRIPFGEEGPPTTWKEITSSVGYLLVGSLLAQFLLNAGPVAVKLLASENQGAAAGRFLAGVVIARVPLSLFQAVQTALLPNLSALAAGQRRDEVRKSILRLSSALLIFGIVVSAGAYAVGTEAVRMVFGRGFEIDRTVLFYLAAGSAAYMLAVALAQAVVALESHARAALGWLGGAVIFLIAAAVGRGLIERVALAYMAGAIAAAICIAGLLFWKLREVP